MGLWQDLTEAKIAVSEVEERIQYLQGTIYSLQPQIDHFLQYIQRLVGSRETHFPSLMDEADHAIERFQRTGVLKYSDFTYFVRCRRGLPGWVATVDDLRVKLDRVQRERDEWQAKVLSCRRQLPGGDRA